MDGCGIVFWLLIIAVVLWVLFAIAAQKQHKERLAELRKDYLEAKASGKFSDFALAARAMFGEVRTGNPPAMQQTATEIYQDSLGFLKTHPDERPFVLEFGRLSYGLKRKDKTPTIYDEQAIQNDIQAHI